MLNLLLLEAILYIYIFSYQYCNFIGQNLLSNRIQWVTLALVSDFVGLHWAALLHFHEACIL